MNPIIQTIKAAERILVTTHADPDGDAVGSLLAMGLALEQLGKQTMLYNESPIPAVYQFLPAVGRIGRRLDAVAVYDAAVVLDCGDLPRIGGAGCPVGAARPAAEDRRQPGPTTATARRWRRSMTRPVYIRTAASKAKPRAWNIDCRPIRTEKGSDFFRRRRQWPTDWALSVLFRA